ncbi:hypothetical protein KP509_09G070400 [Ceratopteris richardii]|uniref:Uncharacterized protein n=1 Tax=Ceratopteris richardii TaxID=49495 RepID=A0A8T2U7L8_CERRI|nr:hypothetical protein KP509_09G070400 [Ceratopteris richardii]
MSIHPAHKAMDSDPTHAAASSPSTRFDSTELLVASCLLHLFLDASGSCQEPASTQAEPDLGAISGFRRSSLQVRKRNRGEGGSVTIPKHGAGAHGGEGFRSKVPRFRNLSDIYSKSASIELQ